MCGGTKSGVKKGLHSTKDHTNDNYRYLTSSTAFDTDLVFQQFYVQDVAGIIVFGVPVDTTQLSLCWNSTSTAILVSVYGHPACIGEYLPGDAMMGNTKGRELKTFLSRHVYVAS